MLYSLEVTDPKKSTYTMLSNLIKRVVYQIFSISDSNSIKEIRNFELLCKEKSAQFLRKIHAVSRAVLNSVTTNLFNCLYFIFLFLIFFHFNVILYVCFSNVVLQFVYCCVLPNW